MLRLALIVIVVAVSFSQGIRECNVIMESTLSREDMFGFSGYLQTDSSNSNSLYYQFYCFKGCHHRNIKTKPMVIYLEGGPGNSSQISNLFESGVNSLEKGSFRLSENAFSWLDFASIIYFDQPVGTGLSFLRDNSSVPINAD